MSCARASKNIDCRYFDVVGVAVVVDAFSVRIRNSKIFNKILSIMKAQFRNSMEHELVDMSIKI